MSTMGMRIRRRRKQLGMSLDKLAEKAGVSKSYLQAIETREANLSVDKAKALAAALNLTVDGLLHGDSTATDADRLFEERFRQLSERDKNLLRQLVDTMWLELQQENKNGK